MRCPPPPPRKPRISPGGASRRSDSVAVCSCSLAAPRWLGPEVDPLAVDRCVGKPPRWRSKNAATGCRLLQGAGEYLQRSDQFCAAARGAEQVSASGLEKGE